MRNKFFYIIFAFLIAVIVLQVFVLINTSGKSIGLPTVDDNKIKELANTLLNKELYLEAISEYLKYLEKVF